MRGRVVAWVRRWGPLVGLLTGTAGFLLGGASFLRTTLTPIDVTLEQASYADRHILDMRVVNGATRPVNLVGGEVRWNGFVVGTIVAIQPVTDSIVAFHRPETIRPASQPLPFSIAAGGSFAGRLLWEDDPGLSDDLVRRLDRRMFRRTRVSNERLDARGVEVHLEFDPGGDKDESVALPFESQYPAATTAATGWHAEACADRQTGEIRRLYLITEQPGPSVVHLDVWRRGAPRPVRSLDRPMAADLPTMVRFTGLRPGAYTWALRSETGTVAVGDFTTPQPTGDDDADVVGACFAPPQRYR